MTSLQTYRRNVIISVCPGGGPRLTQKEATVLIFDNNHLTQDKRKNVRTNTHFHELPIYFFVHLLIIPCYEIISPQVGNWSSFKVG